MPGSRDDECAHRSQGAGRGLPGAATNPHTSHIKNMPLLVIGQCAVTHVSEHTRCCAGTRRSKSASEQGARGRGSRRRTLAKETGRASARRRGWTRGRRGWTRVAGEWRRSREQGVPMLLSRLGFCSKGSKGPRGRVCVGMGGAVRSVSTVSTIPGIGPGRGQSSSAFDTEGFRWSRDRRTCAGGGEGQLWQIRLRTVCGMAVRQPCVEALWVRENGARQAVA